MTHVTHPIFVTHLTHDPWPIDPFPALDHGTCFPFELCIPSYSGRSDGVHFRWMFCMNYRFAVTMLLNHLPYFRNFDDVTNTVARYFSVFSIKRFSLTANVSNAFEKRQIWLIWQWKCQLANLVANRDWLGLTVTVLQATPCKIRSTKVWVY